MSWLRKGPEVIPCPYCKKPWDVDKPHYCGGIAYVPLNYKPEKKK